MNIAILTKVLRDRRRSLIGNSIGLTLLIVWLGVLFPILRESEDFVEMIERIPPEMSAAFGLDPATFLTAAGFLSTEFYSLFAPLLILIFVISAAISETASEERDGLMDILLSAPIHRRRVFLAKAGGIALAALLLVTVTAVALLVVNPIFDMDLAVIGVLAASLSLWLLGVLFGGVALVVGSYSGRTVVAAGTAGLAACASWFVDGFSDLYGWLEAPSAVSPFTWYLEPNPLIEGFTSGHLWLVITTVALSAAGALLFLKRDIATERVVLSRFGIRRRAGSRDRTPRPRAAWMLTGLLRKALWDRRRALWGWGGGLGLLTLVMFSAWPALARDAEALTALMTSMPEEVFAMFGMTDPEAIVTPAGFISSRTYQTIGPLLVIMFAIRGVSIGLVREEHSGVLDLLLSNPSDRSRVIAAKSGGIAFTTALVVLFPTVMALIGDVAWGTDLGAGGILAASAGLGLLGLFFGSLTMLLWALGGASFPAVRIAAVAALATFLLNGLGSLADGLGPIRAVSPFFWYFGDGPPLAKGFEPAYLLLLLGTLLMGWIAIDRFRRRDLAT